MFQKVRSGEVKSSQARRNPYEAAAAAPEKGDWPLP